MRDRQLHAEDGLDLDGGDLQHQVVHLLEGSAPALGDGCCRGVPPEVVGVGRSGGRHPRKRLNDRCGCLPLGDGLFGGFEGSPAVLAVENEGLDLVDGKGPSPDASALDELLVHLRRAKRGAF